MIVSIPDELIMAYADGELTGPMAKRVREAIPQDEAIRQKYEMFHATRHVLSRTLGGVLDEPVPSRLTKAIKSRRPRMPN